MARKVVAPRKTMAFVNPRDSSITLTHPSEGKRGLVIDAFGFRILDMDPEDAGLWINSYDVKRQIALGNLKLVEADTLKNPPPEPFGPEFVLTKPADIQTVNQILYSSDESLVKEIIVLEPKRGTYVDVHYLKETHLPILRYALEKERKGTNRGGKARPEIVSLLEKRVGEIQWKYT